MADESSSGFTNILLSWLANSIISALTAVGVVGALKFFSSIPWWVYALAAGIMLTVVVTIWLLVLPSIVHFWDSVFSPALWAKFKTTLRQWAALPSPKDYDSKEAKKILKAYRKYRVRLSRVVTLNKALIMELHYREGATGYARGIYNNLHFVLAHDDPKDFFDKCRRNTKHELDCFDDNFALISERNSLWSRMRK